MPLTSLNQYIAATNTHEFEKVLPHLDSSFSHIFNGQLRDQMDEIKAYFTSNWKAIQDEDYSVRDDLYTYVDTNETVLLVIYTYHFKGIQNGQLIEGQGKATNIFRKNDSTKKWVLLHEHLSKS